MYEPSSGDLSKMPTCPVIQECITVCFKALYCKIADVFYIICICFLCIFFLCEKYDNSITVCMHAKSLQSCVTLCDPMDYIARQAPLSMGILQARILEWVAMPSSRGSSQPRD